LLDIHERKEREMQKIKVALEGLSRNIQNAVAHGTLYVADVIRRFKKSRFFKALSDQRGDVPGWVLVVLMTTGLVTAIWTIAAPRLTAILKNALDSMNGIK
jgi:hypothetical protein